MTTSDFLTTPGGGTPRAPTGVPPLPPPLAPSTTP